jgi:hypothetical protein
MFHFRLFIVLFIASVALAACTAGDNAPTPLISVTEVPTAHPVVTAAGRETTTAETVARDFYNWYLDYIGTGETFRNPLADRAYRGHPLLSESLVAAVDVLGDTPEGFGFDPFLRAQNVPQGFTVEPTANADQVIVHFQFGESDHPVLVTVSDGRINRISDVAPATEPPAGPGAATDWVTQSDDANGLSFTYPASWVARAVDLAGAGMPSDWPVVTGWSLMPPEVAAALDAPAAEPDPNAPVAPLLVEVVRGDRAALERAYPIAGGELAEFGDQAAIVARQEPGYTHYIFVHPARADTWLVLTDWVTGFPGREAQAEAVAPVLGPLLNGLRFVP